MIGLFKILVVSQFLITNKGHLLLHKHSRQVICFSVVIMPQMQMVETALNYIHPQCGAVVVAIAT